MKRYIKPNTNIQQIEMIQMIAESGNTFTSSPSSINVGGAGSAPSDAGGGGALGKGNNFSLWGDSEEEE